MDSIAIIIIQKENVLIFSCRFDREAFHKIRVDQLGWPTNENENNVRSDKRCDRIDATG